MHPAITPSRNTEPCSRSMSAAVILALAVVPRQPNAVVRVTKVGRQRGAVGDGTPGIGMAPRAAAADPARAGSGAARIFGWRQRVEAVVVPVRAPLVTDAGEVGEAEGIGRCGRNLGRSAEASRRSIVAPRPARAVEAAARGLLPFGLRRQAGSGPGGGGPGPVPRPTDHRL